MTRKTARRLGGAALLAALCAGCGRAGDSSAASDSPPPVPAPAVSPSRPPAGPADLVLLHGNIVTLDEKRPRARALAARGPEIVAVGSDEEIAPLAGPATEVVDLEGRLVLPGFIEGHGHFLALGQAGQELDLRRAATWEEAV